MKPLQIISFFSLLVLCSCHHFFGKRIHGDGILKTENRGSGSFNSIDVGGSMDIYVKQDSTYSVRIEADENLLEYIHVVNDGGVLRVNPERGYDLDATKGIKVYVSAPSFKSLDASGACDIYSDGKITSSDNLDVNLSGSCDAKIELNTPKVSADLSGACKLELKGETKEFKVEGSGSTNIKCMELMAENVSVDISGSGNADVYASVKLDIGVSGAGDVRYKGNATVSQHISGAGSVKKVE